MAKRTITSVRPTHGDGPTYSPQRDLAYLYAPAMRESLLALDQIHWQDDVAELIERLGITEEDISVAVHAITQAHLLFVNDPDVQAPVDALTKVGYFDASIGARYLIHARMGEVMLGGFFVALRDTSELGQESSQHHEIADFVAAGVEVTNRASGQVESPSEMSDLRQRLVAGEAELLGARAATQAMNTRREEELAGVTAILEENNKSVKMRIDEVVLLERDREIFISILNDILEEGFWKGILNGIRRWWIGGSKALESKLEAKENASK